LKWRPGLYAWTDTRQCLYHPGRGTKHDVITTQDVFNTIRPSGKIIVTGDLTQIDLPYSQQSGLKRALSILSGIDGIAQVFLNEEDVVRHRLVKDIVKAYNISDAEIREQKEKERAEKAANATSKQNSIDKINSDL
jgi:hypothetical protein